MRVLRPDLKEKLDLATVVVNGGGGGGVDTARAWVVEAGAPTLDLKHRVRVRVAVVESGGRGGVDPS